MNIIVKGKHSERVRRQVEVAKQNLAGYYKLECEKGSRFQSKLTKGVIKKVYEAATNPDAIEARESGTAGGSALEPD